MDFRFSILVPTRQRPDTLPATLATLTQQTGDDYEIVVADNFGDAEVDKVVKAAQERHPRIKHIRSDRVLPMAVNWEKGLAACSGQYVSVLGDDDGFLPSTLGAVRRLVSIANPRVIAWNVHAYYWPDTIVYWHRNRLYAVLGNHELQWRESRLALVENYRDVVGFGDLPTIYNGFVHRDVINTVKSRFGGYFVPVDMSPDVCSGILNLVHTGRYLFSGRPLAVRGTSRRSNGTSFWKRSLGKEQQEIYQKEEGKTLEQLAHPTLNASANLGFGVAMTKLHLKDLLFPHDDELRIDLSALIKHTIATLNDDPDAYDDNLADALKLADRIGFTVDPRTIPPRRRSTENTQVRGPFQNPKSDVNIAVDCSLLNIFDVAGAAWIAEAMSTPALIEEVRSANDATPLRKAG